jgi:hypothetical protein
MAQFRASVALDLRFTARGGSENGRFLDIKCEADTPFDVPDDLVDRFTAHFTGKIAGLEQVKSKGKTQA